jgi:hypothetical protein
VTSTSLTHAKGRTDGGCEDAVRVRLEEVAAALVGLSVTVQEGEGLDGDGLALLGELTVGEASLVGLGTGESARRA